MSHKRTTADYIAYGLVALLLIAAVVATGWLLAVLTPLDLAPAVAAVGIMGSIVTAIICVNRYRNTHPKPAKAPDPVRTLPVHEATENETSTQPYTPKITDTQAIPTTTGTKRLEDIPDEDLDNLSDKELQILQIRATREVARATAQQTESQLSMHEEDHPASYEHRFHAMKLIIEATGIIAVALLPTIAIFFVDDVAPTLTLPPITFWIFVILWVIVIVWAWYAWLAWFNRDFVANKNRCSMPRPMPWPIPDDNPTIDVGISSIAIERGFIDKIFGTCTLKLDSPSEGDEMFAVVHWLKYPDELRDALGLTPPSRRRVFRRGKKTA